MPELPEVETVREGLNRLTSGKVIKKVTVRVPKMIKTDPILFQENLVDQEILSVSRRGKYLIFHLTDYELISHLRMEGKYLLFLDDIPENKHFHLFWTFNDNSTLIYQDVRKFGTFDLCDKGEAEAFFKSKKLGPEPIEADFDVKVFKDALAKSRKPIKLLLLDQTLVVGLGNIYVDEVLWHAKIHPKRPANSLKQKEIDVLHQAIIATIELAISKGGSTIRTYKNALGKEGSMQEYLRIYGKTGSSCPRCQEAIQKSKLGGRGTHFCPNCQVL